MPERLNHTERLQALIEGVKPDRTPISLWRHFYEHEDDLDRFVEAMIGWQRRFDWDFLKINPRASYHYEPWGVKMRPSPDGLIKPQRIEFPIQKPDDWEKIVPLPNRPPQFDFQLRAIARIRRALPKPFPLVMTVFNPISVAGDMVASEEMFIQHLRTRPDLIEWALTAIAATFVDFVTELRNAGADGIFFATTQWASADRLTRDEVRHFGIAFDRTIWEAAGADAFNVLHVCDANCHLADYAEFPAALTNWDVALPGNPTLREGSQLVKRPILGGIRHATDLVNDPPDILYEKTRRLLDEHGDLFLAVGPGCAVPVTVPLANIEAVRRAVEPM